MLMQDDSNTRYVVELQLGKTDETHIIRTIEYWDNERKRYPNYKYVAVIIAEEITNRFFNVISLFNGVIPIIAIQLKAIRINDDFGLFFTTVLDVATPDDDDEEIVLPTSRQDWASRSSSESLRLTDALFSRIESFAPNLSLNYNKYYIGLKQSGVANNFVEFEPKKKPNVIVKVKLRKNQEADERIAESNLDELSYDKQWNQYRFRVKDATEDLPTLDWLFRRAYEQKGGVVPTDEKTPDIADDVSELN